MLPANVPARDWQVFKESAAFQGGLGEESA